MTKEERETKRDDRIAHIAFFAGPVIGLGLFIELHDWILTAIELVLWALTPIVTFLALFSIGILLMMVSMALVYKFLRFFFPYKNQMTR